MPNPETSGNGRYTYLAAWGYALRKTGSEGGAQAVRQRSGVRRRRTRSHHDGLRPRVFHEVLGKAAVFKHIATYYPSNVGAVGGLVGMIGGLGGFFLPIAFGLLNDLTGLWTSCFVNRGRVAGVDGRVDPAHGAPRSLSVRGRCQPGPLRCR